MGGYARRDAFIALNFAFVAFLAYYIAGPRPQLLDGFTLLADAFLNGRLYLTEQRAALELVARPDGGWYVPYPPMPAVAFLPGVIVFGKDVDAGLLTALFGALNVALAYLLLLRVSGSTAVAGWLTLGFGLGSVHWWAAGESTVWLIGHVISVTFALLALHLAVRQSRPALAGLMLGCAAAARLPVGLTLPLYLAVYAGLRWPIRLELPPPERLRAVALLLGGLAVPAVLIALYNLGRFGDPTDFGYARIPGVLTEPWYQQGILSPTYIPRHLHVMFMRGFDFVDQPPWFRPNWTGTSLLLTTPVYLWLVKARSRAPFIVFGWIAVLIALIPDITHGTVGMTQFGYRFSLDVAPILWVLLAWVFRRGMPVEAKVAVLLGVLVNAYGIVAITVLRPPFVSF